MQIRVCDPKIRLHAHYFALPERNILLQSISDRTSARNMTLLFSLLWFIDTYTGVLTFRWRHCAASQGQRGSRQRGVRAAQLLPPSVGVRACLLQPLSATPARHKRVH